jgi:hypothetical protein
MCVGQYSCRRASGSGHSPWRRHDRAFRSGCGRRIAALPESPAAPCASQPLGVHRRDSFLTPQRACPPGGAVDCSCHNRLASPGNLHVLHGHHLVVGHMALLGDVELLAPAGPVDREDDLDAAVGPALRLLGLIEVVGGSGGGERRKPIEEPIRREPGQPRSKVRVIFGAASPSSSGKLLCAISARRRACTATPALASRSPP